MEFLLQYPSYNNQWYTLLMTLKDTNETFIDSADLQLTETLLFRLT